MTLRFFICSSFRVFVRAALFVTPAVHLLADVALPSIFSDHVVLQKSARVPVWGSAENGEEITVTLNSAKADVTTGEDGHWQVLLDLSHSGPGPFTLVVQGKNTLTISDVVVGEVWLASGQSNMEFPLRNAVNAQAEIAASANTALRQFTVAKAESSLPAKNCNGQWTVAGSETSGMFSAVGYFFCKGLQGKINAPVGLIHSSWGGSPSEAWTSKEAFETDPELRAGAKKSENELKTYPERLQSYVLALSNWEASTGRKDRSFTGMPLDDWEPTKLPGKISDAGAVWLRCRFQVPADQEGKSFSINLGSIRGVDRIYWNGVCVGEASQIQVIKRHGDRRQLIPAAQVKAGEAVLAVRFFSSTDDIVLARDAEAGTWSRSVWELKTEFKLPVLSEAEKTALPVSPGMNPEAWRAASHLYNAMIHPLIPYAIKGAIWYQGESNIERAYQYRNAFPLLINDWRMHWGEGDFPFYFCQLANMNGKQPAPVQSSWAELREAQALTLAVPHTGQAVLIDLGEAGDVHARNKADVGARLAALALGQTYGFSVPFSGPVYESMKIENGQIRLSFEKTADGLVANPLPSIYVVSSLTGKKAPLLRNSPKSKFEGFAICGVDRKWVWADARIEGNKVVVWSAQVDAPVAVRYGWADNPTCNLYNTAGFPASPFRTDDFPMNTGNARY